MAQAEEIAEQLAPPPPITTLLQQPQPTYSPQIRLQNALDHLHNYYTTSRAHLHRINAWDQRTARWLTEFKRDYILSIGDLMRRSVCMAVGGGIGYKLLSWKGPSLMRRSRNLVICIVVSGWLFVPQLFNPFLSDDY